MTKQNKMTKQRKTKNQIKSFQSSSGGGPVGAADLWSEPKVFGPRAEFRLVEICFIYRVVFLTGPPDFQYQNEKHVAANQH